MALEISLKATVPIPLDLSFRVEPGELLALVGHSGSGKSTILRTIAGLWTPTNGKVTVDGQTWLDTQNRINWPTHRRRLGIVFQSYALFPHMTASANVMSALGHLPAADRPAEALRLLQLVNLSSLQDRLPAQLSGGQQQRVAVARAIARNPSVLLLDEPFSAVDRATREHLYREIQGLRDVLRMPIVLVTHDLEEARLLADRMIVIEHGRLVRFGSVADVMFDPVALRAMGLKVIGSSLPATVEALESDGLARLATSAGPLWVPNLTGPVGMDVRVRVLAPDVMISRERPTGLSALNILPATVTAVLIGDAPGVIVKLSVGGNELLAQITARSAQALSLQAGVECFAIVKSMAIAKG